MTPSTDISTDHLDDIGSALEDAVYLVEDVPESFTAASCALLPHAAPTDVSGSEQSDAGPSR